MRDLQEVITCPRTQSLEVAESGFEPGSVHLHTPLSSVHITAKAVEIRRESLLIPPGGIRTGFTEEKLWFVI